MWQSLHDAWWRLATQHHPQTFSDALACSVLSTGSVVYRGAVALRNTAYDRGWARQVRLPCRVVSVGNLTVGGTGKTTCVELIVRKLAGQGRRVAVLSRGYGGMRRAHWLRWEQERLCVDGDGSAALEGLADEPQLLARHLAGVPVVVGSRRAQSGRLACERFAADALVLDDAFQHRGVRRDCDIVLIHARMPFSGWALLPRGPMREPLDSLRRADVVIITKADEALGTLGALTERLRAVNPRALLATAVHEPSELVDGLAGTRVPTERLEGGRVALLSSIGDPEGFEATVRRLHATVAWHQAFPDHHPYRSEDWAAVGDRLRQTQPEALVTTEKDWIRLRPHAQARPAHHVTVWVLGVRMKLVSGEEALDARLARL